MPCLIRTSSRRSVLRFFICALPCDDCRYSRSCFLRVVRYSSDLRYLCSAEIVARLFPAYLSPSSGNFGDGRFCGLYLNDRAQARHFRKYLWLSLGASFSSSSISELLPHVGHVRSVRIFITPPLAKVLLVIACLLLCETYLPQVPVAPFVMWPLFLLRFDARSHRRYRLHEA